MTSDTIVQPPLTRDWLENASTALRRESGRRWMMQIQRPKILKWGCPKVDTAHPIKITNRAHIRAYEFISRSLVVFSHFLMPYSQRKTAVSAFLAFLAREARLAQIMSAHLSGVTREHCPSALDFSTSCRMLRRFFPRCIYFFWIFSTSSTYHPNLES